MNVSLLLAGLWVLRFVDLKMTGRIDYSWFWLFTPVWLTIAFLLAVLLVAFVFGFSTHIFEALAKRKKKPDFVRAKVVDEGENTKN